MNGIYTLAKAIGDLVEQLSQVATGDVPAQVAGVSIKRIAEDLGKLAQSWIDGQ